MHLSMGRNGKNEIHTPWQLLRQESLQCIGLKLWKLLRYQKDLHGYFFWQQVI